MTPLQAIQATLVGEHAAVYVYGVVGGRVSSSADPALAAKVAQAYTTHRGRRDQLTAMVRAAGADPVAADVSYRLPNPATTVRQLEAVALHVERQCTEVYAQMVGNTSRANRQWAIEALTDAAVRQLGFGGSPQPFPGLPEL
ncbi:MAG: ferritin-like domain-containing protein [Nocardioides sp.]